MRSVVSVLFLLVLGATSFRARHRHVASRLQLHTLYSAAEGRPASTTAGAPSGHGHGHGGPPRDPNAPYSFVQDDMRAYAMKLHTKDQAPREGQQPAETPFSAWEPGRKDYIRFLVDSLLVYETMDKIVAQHAVLQPFRKTGLERAEAIKEDLKWLCSFDKSLSIPPVGESGLKYAAFLEKIAAEVCSPPLSSISPHRPLTSTPPPLQLFPTERTEVHVPLLQPLLCAHGGWADDRQEDG